MQHTINDMKSWFERAVPWRRLMTVVVFAIAGQWGEPSMAADRPAPPSVLFLVVDDMNDWISLLDPKEPIQTPNLERLAQRGMLFTRAYCASPACNPSRVATLPGLRPTTTGVYGNKSDWRGAVPIRLTIMQQFIAAEYDVRGAGKIFQHHATGARFERARQTRKVRVAR